MATGRKNYFRHNNQASSDPFITSLMNEYGPSGYAWWFILLELCHQYHANSDEKLTGKFRFHERFLRQKLRISREKLRHFLGFCQTFSKVFPTFCESFIDLDIPNTLKFFSKYEKAGAENAPNKTKLNKIKLNKIKLNEIKEIKVTKENQIGFCHELFRPSKWSYELIDTKNISENLQNAWVEKYPLDFILGEFEKIHLWLMANPESKKKNYGAFINNWLSRGHVDFKITNLKIVNGYKTKAEIIQDKLVNMKNPYAEK